MSEQQPNENPETTAASDETEESEEAGGSTITQPVNPLSRPTDAVARPGFRNPPNNRTKVQKSRKKRRK
ncbi:MAG: hypothetical protein ACI8S6_004040 [Myxococcota bacterium]|jgi:hypothetical protein